MEYVSGIKLKDIFLDNGNWWKFFLKYRQFIKPNIIINVLKFLVCRTWILGYHIFECPNDATTVKRPNCCKSRFCPPCGKRVTDDWIKTSLNTLPKTVWQHITLTLPDLLWPFFWTNRYLRNEIPAIAAGVIKDLAETKGFYPGIFLAIHTFGRDLKRNFHIHLSTTLCGLSLTRDRWIKKPAFFHHAPVKTLWKNRVIKFFREEFKKGKLKMPPHLKHIKDYSTFYSWTVQSYNKTWNVQLCKSSTDPRLNVEYLGKYLKRPPIGETRIKYYDGQSVTFEFLDHQTKTKELKTLPVLDFIARLIAHIPDKNFRNIRYYGFLSNKLRGKLLPIVYGFLHMKGIIKKKVYTPWRDMLKYSFGHDPLICLKCGALMRLKTRVDPLKVSLLSLHRPIANEYLPLRI